jgi:hypothetical protein
MPNDVKSFKHRDYHEHLEIEDSRSLVRICALTEISYYDPIAGRQRHHPLHIVYRIERTHAIRVSSVVDIAARRPDLINAETVGTRNSVSKSHRPCLATDI